MNLKHIQDDIFATTNQKSWEILINSSKQPKSTHIFLNFSKPINTIFQWFKKQGYGTMI